MIDFPHGHPPPAGVAFSACEERGDMVGVMGIQPVRNVDLIRHA
jgi:hypothetical protein